MTAVVKSATSSRKSDPVNRCVFTWKTFLPNFIPIRFETTKRWAFFEKVAPNNNKNKMSSDMRSVPDLNV